VKKKGGKKIMEIITWDRMILPAWEYARVHDWKTVKEYAHFKFIPRWKMLKRAVNLNRKMLKHASGLNKKG
jgi:hypothetical protein